MEWLQSLLDNGTTPALTAFVLGLLTAVSPCPLATNITAVGYIGREIDNPRRMFIGGLLYTAGRTIAYTALGVVLITILREGASIFSVQRAVGRYGEMVLPPALILIGMFMLWGHRLNLPRIGWSGTAAGEKLTKRTGWGALWLGVLFAMAFCPASGVLYFGMLIPMSVTTNGGWLLPPVFAIATALPVIAAAWVLSFGVSGIGRFYNRMKVFQIWFNRVVTVLFILVGIYYASIQYV